jgi:hypothetical protein
VNKTVRGYVIHNMNPTDQVSLFAPLAYIDGGSGSMFFQVVVAGALTVGYVARTYWGNIVSTVSRTFKKNRAAR